MKIPKNQNSFYILVDSLKDQREVNKFCEQNGYTQRNTGRLNIVKVEKIGYKDKDIKRNKISLGVEQWS